MDRLETKEVDPRSPHALRKIIGNFSSTPGKSMFQLSALSLEEKFLSNLPGALNPESFAALNNCSKEVKRYNLDQKMPVLNRIVNDQSMLVVLFPFPLRTVRVPERPSLPAPGGCTAGWVRSPLFYESFFKRPTSACEQNVCQRGGLRRAPHHPAPVQACLTANEFLLCHQPCEHCVCKWGEGSQPPPPPRVRSCPKVCLTGSGSSLKPAMYDMSLLETPIHHGRSMFATRAGCAPTPSRLRKLA